MRNASRLEITAVVLLLALSLALRFAGLDRFVANDEIRWTCRSIQFRQALREREWASTFRTGHPGVLTTWLGAIFIPPDQEEAEAACQTAEGGMALDKIEVSPAGGTHAMMLLGRLLFAGRRGVALFTWVCLAAMYPLMRSLFGPEVALGSLVLIALDPFHLALSRVLHIDGVLASLMTLSLLSLLVARRRSNSNRTHLGMVVLSGALGGLAMLEKSPALFLGLFSALVIAFDVAREKPASRSWARGARDVILWAAVASIVYVALWPAMWVEPVRTIERVFSTAVGYAEEGHDPGSYFLGAAVEKPDWRFYPVVLLFRQSPVTLIGLAIGAGLVTGIRQRRVSRSDELLLMAYALLFGASMSLGAKKLDRYLLPVFPSLAIVASAGLMGAVGLVWKRLPGIPSSATRWVIYVTIPLQLVLLLPHHPHYFTYYNPLVGGLHQARETLKVGWGEGYEAAAAYLNQKPNAEHLEVVAPNFAAFAPLFHGGARPMGDYSASRTDYVLFYLAQVQRRHDEQLMAAYLENPDAKPEQTIVLHGVEYAWIYPNTVYIEPVRHLENEGDPAQDVLVLNRDSVLGKRYNGALEVREFGQESRSVEIAGLLDGLEPGVSRVWYAHTEDADPEAVARLLQNRAVLLEERNFPSIDLRLYGLAAGQPPKATPDVQFGGLELTGYEMTEPPPAWGRDGGVFLHWAGKEAISRDYTAFAHLYNIHGQRIALGDTLIVSRDLLPTSQWEPGTSGTTLHHLSIPLGTPPGTYELRVGVYDSETGERLPRLAHQGEAGGSWARLDGKVGLPDGTPNPEELDIAHRTDRQLATGPVLLGFDLESPGVPAGDTIVLTLFWQGQNSMSCDYGLRLGLIDGAGTPMAEQDVSLVSTEYSTSQWRPGELIRETYHVSTDIGMPTGEATITLNLVGEQGETLLEHAMVVAPVWIQSRERSSRVPAGVDISQTFTLGEMINLLGHRIDPTESKPGQTISVTLFWGVDGAVSESYKVFVHVYDDVGNLVQQRDRLPALGIRPTASWERGEVIADRYHLEIGEDLLAGRYEVAVGMYDPETGHRLPTFGPGGERLDQDRISLGWIRVNP